MKYLIAKQDFEKRCKEALEFFDDNGKLTIYSRMFKSIDEEMWEHVADLEQETLKFLSYLYLNEEVLDNSEMDAEYYCSESEAFRDYSFNVTGLMYEDPFVGGEPSISFAEFIRRSDGFICILRTCELLDELEELCSENNSLLEYLSTSSEVEKLKIVNGLLLEELTAGNAVDWAEVAKTDERSTLLTNVTAGLKSLEIEGEIIEGLDEIADELVELAKYTIPSDIPEYGSGEDEEDYDEEDYEEEDEDRPNFNSPFYEADDSEKELLEYLNTLPDSTIRSVGEDYGMDVSGFSLQGIKNLLAYYFSITYPCSLSTTSLNRVALRMLQEYVNEVVDKEGE